MRSESVNQPGYVIYYHDMEHGNIPFDVVLQDIKSFGLDVTPTIDSRIYAVNYMMRREETSHIAKAYIVFNTEEDMNLYKLVGNFKESPVLQFILKQY